MSPSKKTKTARTTSKRATRGTPQASDARTRLIETADRLFYVEGIRNVGIDRVIAEAGVAKMTLYHHFASKDDLIGAVLLRRDETLFAFLNESVDRRIKRRPAGGALGAFFGALREWFESPGFRGCAFINASAELADPSHPGFAFVQDHKRRFHAYLADLVAASAPDGMSKTAIASRSAAIAVLVEGAIVIAVIEGKPSVADVARDAALELLKSA